MLSSTFWVTAKAEILFIIALLVVSGLPSSTSFPASGKVLSPEYYKSVYEREQSTNEKEVTGGGGTTPWDIGGGRPQPAIVRAFEDGKIRGRILDGGCGAGENCIYLSKKYGIESVVGFDLAEGAISMANNRASEIEQEIRGEENEDASFPFWKKPHFLVASCTEIADKYGDVLASMNQDDENNEDLLFDVCIDSGLLHCLSDTDGKEYVQQISKLVKKDTGRVFVGCFSTANPDPWDNPRRLDEEYLRALFCEENGFEMVSVRDTWWARPPERGSSQGAFCAALWMEARRL